jgi:hypothetical protein
MSGCYTLEGRTTVPTEDAMAARGPGWHRVIHHVPETEQSGVRELMDRVDDSDRVITHAANVPGWGALMSYQNAAPVHPFFPAAE